MRRLYFALVSLLLLATTGCGTPAPATSTRLERHESVSSARRVLLLTDVCLSRRPLAGDDYFLVEDSRRSAMDLQRGLDSFLERADVRIAVRAIPFVCGALHEPDNKPKLRASTIDAPTESARQPLWVEPQIQADALYAQALQVLTTHLFETSLAQFSETKRNAGIDAGTSGMSIAGAASIVAARTGTDSLIYVGVTGTSLSPARVAATRTVQVLAGVAISLAVGPIALSQGTQVGLVFVPGAPIDMRQMVGSTVDLRSGQILFSNVVRAGGDPLDASVIASPESIALLLRELTFRRASSN